MKTARTRILWLLAIAGCGDVEAPAVGVTEERVTTSENVAAGPIELPIGCAQAQFSANAPLIPIPPELPDHCIAASAQQATRILDDCETKNWTLTGCDIPFGAQFCHDGEWTVVCQDDSQCPIGMRCTWGDGVGTVDVANWAYGWCAKRCTGTAAAECIRCDMQCNKDLGVCLKPQPLHEPL